MLLATFVALSGCGRQQEAVEKVPHWIATRSENNPLLTTSSEGMIEEHGYRNVNGPAVVKAPAWHESRLGQYYMYFAHHRGSFIRLAYADTLDGPWTIWPEPVLRLENAPNLDHVASPDVHVDEKARIVRMYYHSVDDTNTWQQTTYLATSSDGLAFEALWSPVAPPYLRAFKIGVTWWAVAKVRGGPGGVLLRSQTPEGPYRVGPRIVPNMRHAGVLVEGEKVHVFFSRIGDTPERLLSTTFNPKRRWIQQAATEVTEVLQPLFDYEGANLPVVASREGQAQEPENALRDPFVFSENGRNYLFYSVAGESGIAVAQLERRGTIPEAK